MRLAQRLLLGAIAVILALAIAIMLIAGSRLDGRLGDQLRDELHRDARLVARMWHAGAAADSLADAVGEALDYRVTLIDPAGRVVGDSEFDGAALGALDDHGSRPEVRAALDSGSGSAVRVSPSAGDREMYAAVRGGPGVVRMSVGTARLDDIVDRAERDVLIAALLAAAGSMLLAWVFARTISRPIVELRDVATAIAGGDLSVRPALAAPGEVGDLATALHEMTEQLAFRLESLREEDALLTTLFESLNEGVLALDQRRTIVRINGRAREFLQLRSDTPLSADQLPRSTILREIVDAAMGGEITEPTELHLHGRTLAVTARPLAAGGAVVALFDLTALRRLENVRRDFVANVSHELKTPLTVVRGFAETLLDPGVATADRQRFIETIAANAERMQRIVDDLLDLSRIESGHWSPAPEPVDLAGIVTDTFTGLRARADARHVTLTSHLDTARVYADPTALRQVLSNLVENAVRHTTQGSVDVTAAHAADAVEIAVRDTGIGIDAEHLPRIFERFYRVDPARARAEGGTGLGLAIVKHLVEAHGGRVRAASAPGKGTTIVVSLPDPA